MGRLLIAGLLTTSVLAAAPVPRDEAGRIARLYGTTHDPDKGAEFRCAGNTLIVTTPLEPRLLAPAKGVLNAPRVWREVRGAFTATVRVSFPIRSAVPARHEDAVASRAGGGLVVWFDDANFLTLTREERESDGRPGEYFRSECSHNGSRGGYADFAKPQRSGYLRVLRWEKGLKCSYGPDGKTWTALGSYPCEWGEKW
jgi:hypothetical protein